MLEKMLALQCNKIVPKHATSLKITNLKGKNI